MKNNYYLFLCYIIFFLFFFHQVLKSNEFLIEAKLIETLDENIIIAKDNIKVSNNNGQFIKSEKLEYNKNLNTYIFTENVVYFDNNKIEINSDKLILNQNEKKYIFDKNIVFKDKKKEIILLSDNIIYNKIDNKFISNGKTKINLEENFFIETSSLEIDKNKNTIYSNKKTFVKDKLNNTLVSKDGFKFNDKTKTFFAKEVLITDINKNIYEIDEIFYDLNLEKIYGKDIFINRNNKNLIDSEYISRSKSRALLLDKDFLKLKKSVYTNCKNNDGCPPWLISSKEITHDKEAKRINYKNAVVKFYNIPVAYFPRFFHPDPTVKRQSGFLAPKISAQNSESFLQIPYFFALSESSDFTFSPRIYENNQNILQGEYRKISKKTNSTSDFSIKNEDILVLDEQFKNSHFFLNSEFKTNYDLFDTSSIKLKLESVSNRDYLKTFNIESPIISSQTLLNSNIEFQGFADDYDILINSEVYEDLSKYDSDRFEFIAPSFQIDKKIQTNLNGILNFQSKGFNKFYNTDINEKIFINDLHFKSLNKYGVKGLVSNYEMNLKNFNSQSKNSLVYSNTQKTDLKGIIQFNSKLPMKKGNVNYYETITPKIAVKLNPFKNRNIIKEDRLVDYGNIFSFNRLNTDQTLEGGQSLTLGNEYKIFRNDNQSQNNEIFGLNLATSIRNEENNDLPKKSYLGQKTSNITGQSTFNYNDIINFKYDFLIDNNLDTINYHSMNSTIRVNNFVTQFEYTEENNLIGNQSFISNNTTYRHDKNTSFAFKTRKNKETNLTEYYNILYQYKMDCLTAGVEYKKDYYSDQRLKPQESLFFSITIMPFDNTLQFPSIK